MSTEAQTSQPVQDLNVIDGEVIEIKTPAAALAVMNPSQYGRELMEPYAKQLTAARRKVGREKFDITTKEGMATAKQLKKLFVTIRTDADEAKSNAKRPIDAAGKAILAEFKPIEDGAKAEEKKIADQIAAEEARIEAEKQAKIAAERVRIEAIEGRLAQIRSFPSTLALASSEKISTTINTLLAKQLEKELYDEFLEDAIDALNTTIDQLREHLTAALAREEAARIAEENARELARLKAEQAERDRVAEAAAKAQAEQMAAMQRQQQQMNEIMGIQNLGSSASALTGRYAVELALQKVDQFNPANYGDMQSMAEMVRKSSQAALEARLAQLPEPVAEPSPIAPPPVAEAEPTAQYVDQDAPTAEPAPAVQTIAPAVRQRPSEEAIVQMVARGFGVDDATAMYWLLDMNQDKLALVA